MKLLLRPVETTDLLFVNLPGEEVQKTWRERQAWFRQTAPKMNLDKR